jgi:hypothetical protein
MLGTLKPNACIGSPYLASEFKLNVGGVGTLRPISIKAQLARQWWNLCVHIGGKAIIEHASVWNGR